MKPSFVATPIATLVAITQGSKLTRKSTNLREYRNYEKKKKNTKRQQTRKIYYFMNVVKANRMTYGI